MIFSLASTPSTKINGETMRQAKYSIREEQAEVLSRFKSYGFKDKSATLRAALSCFQKEMAREQLKKSADLCAEIYSEDDDLKEWPEPAADGWPE